MTAQKKYKVDIFRLLGSLSKRSTHAYDELTADEKKTVQPLILMRWMSGTSDARQVYFLNELVNPFVFPFYKHNELLVKLLSICGPGQPRRYKWVKASSKKSTKLPESTKVVQEVFGYNKTDAVDALRILSDNDILSYATSLGRQDDEIKVIKKELKSRG